MARKSNRKKAGRTPTSPVPAHLGIDEGARRTSIAGLNQILADLSALRALYKHFHWRVAGRRFIMLHKLYDKHAEQVLELVDMVAERIQMLGGQATAWPGDVAAAAKVARPAGGFHSPDMQLMALLAAHRIVLEEAHRVAEKAENGGDAGTNDLLASHVIPEGQLQAWFVGEHLDHGGGE